MEMKVASLTPSSKPKVRESIKGPRNRMKSDLDSKSLNDVFLTLTGRADWELDIFSAESPIHIHPVANALNLDAGW